LSGLRSTSIVAYSARSVRPAVASLLVAFVLAWPASASAAEPGFVRGAAIESAASWVAGKPVQAWCPTSFAVWDAFARSKGFRDGDQIGGWAYFGGSEAWFHPVVCEGIARRVSGDRTLPIGLLAYSLLLVAHEALHSRGLVDESETDCAALRILPEMAVRFYGFRYTSLADRRHSRVVRMPSLPLWAVIETAWALHRGFDPIYTRLC
jgi:hypothetical protein